ncbi:MAG: tetratricopeptide repeat protein [Butyrivibrio sp.]|nr:tetratricopeptide repeat protein [Butyrivibrio sp.]
MDKQIIEDYRIISTIRLVGAIKEGIDSSERFCFILGSGASVSSGIPMGGELERRWMSEMEKHPGLAEVHETAEKLKGENRLEYDFKEIEEAWKKSKDLGTPLPSEYYFDIYKLRFFPNSRNGYHYLEKLMADANPSFGYHPLTLMLTDKGRNNLVITTNFDSLVEDALFMYTSSKPLVINHELLADYAGDPNISRPIIAKVHRGIFFDPLNMPEETDSLKDKWHNVLESVFQSYTPIVIGYGGGDNSLMEFLAEESVKMRNGIYWCYMEEYGLPNEKIQKLVQQKKGFLVRTAGFDAIMLAIGNALFPDNIEPHKTGKYLEDRMKLQIENYETEYNKLIEREENINTMDINGEPNQSEDEFRKEIEKIEDRLAISENERKKSNQMTAWDYWRQGYRYYNLGKYESAIECYSYAIEKQPDIAVFYNNRGNIYTEMDENEKAFFDYTKAIELKPDYEDAYYNRGNTYADMGENEKALSDYTKAIELKPDDDDAYNNRGATYADMGENEKAISDYTKAIELKPDHEKAYYNRGVTYADMGENEKALSDYTKAIELKPDYEDAYYNRGVTYAGMGENEKALSDYTKVIELNSEDKNAYILRAKVYRLMGEIEKAVADEEIASKL